MKVSRDKDPVNFVRAKTDKIDRFLLETVKIDRVVNFDAETDKMCRVLYLHNPS